MRGKRLPLNMDKGVPDNQKEEELFMELLLKSPGKTKHEIQNRRGDKVLVGVQNIAVRGN